VSATVPNTQVCGPPPKQKAIYSTACVQLFNLGNQKTLNDMYSRNVLDMDCQTQGCLKLMIERYISEICHKFQ
jgi:hypothetical protein